MAEYSIKELEQKFMNAHNAGDTRAAKLLKNMIVSQESGKTPKLKSWELPNGGLRFDKLSENESYISDLKKVHKHLRGEEWTGNDEDLIEDSSLSQSIRLKYGSGHQEAINKLTQKQLNFLFDLPETKSIKIDEITLLMCHGSPWSNDFYIYPDSNNVILNKCNIKAFNFVLIGHSHYSFAIRNTNSILLNPGSVGQSRQNGGKASWCILNTNNSCFQFFNTDYNTKNLLKEVSEKDSEIKYLSDILKRK